jgi:hypothetical protein
MLLIDKVNVVPGVNKVPRHEDAWASGVVAPCILNLGTSGDKRSASFPGKEPPVPI